MYRENKISREMNITHEYSGMLPLYAERRARIKERDNGILAFHNTTNREVRQCRAI